ncbi:MAG: gliding motility protein, partial [Desulfobacterales bacterium]
MALLNSKDRTIECKIVYYGPGRGGKTTNLEHIFK